MSRATDCFAPNADPAGADRGINLLPRDGEAYLVENALSSEDADRTFEELRSTVTWRQEHATLFGRKILLPRLTAWFGDQGYGYSGIRHDPAPFPPSLSRLKALIEQLAGCGFNSVLLNLYRHGQDSMGWHSDDEPALGPEPLIASLSLGATRRFQLKHRSEGQRVALDLRHGSCLFMRGRCQACWRHQLPKTKKTIGARINLTFRRVQG